VCGGQQVIGNRFETPAAVFPKKNLLAVRELIAISDDF
jgi:hypothetical protein